MTLTVAGIIGSIRSSKKSALSVVDDSLARARDADEKRSLNVFLSLARDQARERALNLETDPARQESAPLLGVPVAVKDNIAIAGLPLTCGSRILEGYVSPYTATVIDRLRAAGAVIIGKTNMDEFAMGSSTENSAFGMTRNPIDAGVVPGGSSGGSAAAVAAGIVPIALGSDTGGSVRQPAAFCGVVGVKPTYGRVSRYGLVAFASSLDQIGVFGATVRDAAIGTRIIAGVDGRDATTADVAVPDFSADGKSSLKGIVIGRPREYFSPQLDAGIAALCTRALDRLRSLGAEIREVSLPHTELAMPAYCVIAPAEASSNLARFDGVRYGLRVPADSLHGMYDATRSQGFGAEVTRRIILGTFVLSAEYHQAYYAKAMHARTLIAGDFRKVFASGVHAMFTPTTPTPAFAPGTRSDPYRMYLSDLFTCPANLAGVPALSLPIGRLGKLPIGGQLMCAHFEEQRMFQLARALEGALGAEAHT